MTPLVEATRLRKRYGSVAALDGLDLAVEEGHVVGLLGPNGAGKTTALRILVGLIRADAGSVGRVGGRPVRRRDRTLPTDGSRRVSRVRAAATLFSSRSQAAP